jgi:hypothetical protein
MTSSSLEDRKRDRIERRTDILRWRGYHVFMRLVREDNGPWVVENPRQYDYLPRCFWDAWANS